MDVIAETEQFVIKKFQEGTYAVFSPDLITYGMCNSGIIDLGGKTIIFDTFALPEIAEEIIKLSEELTGNSDILAVNSHWHWDHVWGNQEFHSQIISSSKTREMLIDSNETMIQSFRKELPKYLAKANKYVERNENGPTLFDFSLADKQDFFKHVKVVEKINESLDTINLRLPDLTFDSRMTIWGENRQVELIEFNGLHSQSDVVLHLPQEKIIWGGDLVINSFQPMSFAEKPSNWKSIFHEIKSLNLDLIIPGHGFEMTFDELTNIEKYWEECEKYGTLAKEQKDPEKFVNSIELPDYLAKSFSGGNILFRNNVKQFVNQPLLNTNPL
ncbi:MAG: MBL fold metallo-hydrolase [Candidatus Kariarchaeaceae archaeon]|jgi:glyoxylase-like metal-dependent hydrolase (beta-lactamase superfamily II)